MLVAKAGSHLVRERRAVYTAGQGSDGHLILDLVLVEQGVGDLLSKLNHHKVDLNA